MTPKNRLYRSWQNFMASLSKAKSEKNNASQTSEGSKAAVEASRCQKKACVSKSHMTALEEGEDRRNEFAKYKLMKRWKQDHRNLFEKRQEINQEMKDLLSQVSFHFVMIFFVFVVHFFINLTLNANSKESFCQNL